MNESKKYILWLKVTSLPTDSNQTAQELLDCEGVSDVQIANVSTSAISKKETVLAITLSVTANFATDGIKKVIELLNEQNGAEVVYCRRPNGEEMTLKKAPQDK